MMTLEEVGLCMHGDMLAQEPATIQTFTARRPACADRAPGIRDSLRHSVGVARIRLMLLAAPHETRHAAPAGFFCTALFCRNTNKLSKHQVRPLN